MWYNISEKEGVFMSTTKKPFKITIKTDSENAIKVVYSPQLKIEKAEDNNRDAYMQMLLGGFHIGLLQIFADLPALRPATELETDNDVYVFVNEIDNEIFKIRRVIYNMLKDYFDNTLSLIFPDIEYILNTQKIQQELAFDLDSGAMEAHLEKIKNITAQVKEEVINEKAQDEQTTKGVSAS